MEPDDRLRPEGADVKRTEPIRPRRAWLRMVLVTVTLVAVLALIAIGVVRIIQS